MGFLSSPERSNQLWCPPNLLFNIYWGYIPALKWPGPDVDRLPQHGMEVKNEWSYTSTPLYVFMAWTETTSAFFYHEYKIYTIEIIISL